MDEKKNDALLDLAGQSTSSSTDVNNTVSMNNIPQSNPDCQALSGKKRRGGRKSWDKRGHAILHVDSKVRSMAVKCYLDQLPLGWDETCNRIRALNLKDYHCVGIKHDRDKYAEEGSFWKPAVEKEHFHIIIRSAQNKSFRVGQLLKQLAITFRPGLDDALWKNHGVESVDNFAGYTTYLTHETPDAMRDGKETYDHSELVSNLSESELNAVREGFLRVVMMSKKPTTDELVELDDLAFKLGYELRSLVDWYDSLSFQIRSHAKMKTIRESYERGVDRRIEEHSEVLRLCIFIFGGANTGKSYSTMKALEGKRVKNIEGGGTGKFDDLRPDHDAIVVSDDSCPNVLNIADNYVCRVYKRGKNNPFWAGQYFIVTSNIGFVEWLATCGVTDLKHIEAMRSRFFICHIEATKDGTNRLAMDSASTRGTVDEQVERAGMFIDFQQKFNATIAQYRPKATIFDRSQFFEMEDLEPRERRRKIIRDALEAEGIKLNHSPAMTEKQYHEDALQYVCDDFWEHFDLSQFPHMKGWTVEQIINGLDWSYIQHSIQCSLENERNGGLSLVYPYFSKEHIRNALIECISDPGVDYTPEELAALAEAQAEESETE